MLVKLDAMDPIHIAPTVLEPANVHHILDYCTRKRRNVLLYQMKQADARVGHTVGGRPKTGGPRLWFLEDCRLRITGYLCRLVS
jgi:hypothetical protein